MRVGIIGTGRIAVDNHVPHIRIAGGEVVALCDSVPGRAGRFAERLGVPHGFDDHKKMLEMNDLDLVTICTPPNVRPDIALEVIAAGKHVYLEKPPALTTAHLHPVVVAAKEKGVRLLAGSHQIYDPEIQRLRALVDKGALGELYYVEALKLLRAGIPRGWHRTKAVSGGGVTFDSTPHRLDIGLFLLTPAKPVHVSARTYDHFAHLSVPDETPGYKLMDVEEGIGDRQARADVEDSVMAMVSFDNGATLLVRDIRLAHMGSDWSFKVLGTKSGAELSPRYAPSKDKPLLTLYRTEEDGSEHDAPQELTPNDEGTHVPVYRHIFSCINDGRETSSNGERALEVLSVLEAIHRSAAKGGQSVSVEEIQL